MPVLATSLIRGAAAALPAARAAARRLIAAAGKAGPVAAGAAIGHTVASFAPQAWGGGAPRRRRARGITAAELRGARKVAALVRLYGLKPKAGRVGGRRRCR